MSRDPRPRLLTALVACLAAVSAAMATTAMGSTTQPSERRLFTEREEAEVGAEEELGEGGEAEDHSSGPNQELYENRAYPRGAVTHDRVMASLSAFRTIESAALADLAPFEATWDEIGPRTTNVPGVVTYTGRDTTISGRVTAMVSGSTCVPGDCRLWMGAAGGGVWRTDDALHSTPFWSSISTGLDTTAIGSLVLDPNDPSEHTLYVGTGEPNGSGDSEAGLGLYKTTDAGDTWTLVSGSVVVAKNRSIGSIAIDPTDPLHIVIGTDVARHGSASVNGGRRTPPDAPTLGVYESFDGGASFALSFALPPNPNPPSEGSDWFQGGVRDLEVDPNDPDTIYAGVLGYGIWRRSPALDGDTDFHQVFGTINPDDTFGDRTEFDLVDLGSTTRIYVGDSSDDLAYSVLWRTDDANRPADELFDGTDNVGYTLLSSSVNGTPGFTSYGICGGQCGYDFVVASPPGKPDHVWMGGQMFYGEIFGNDPPRSNGRTLIRSTDAGVTFQDMTNDDRDPPVGMHPDQQAIAFSADDPGIAFAGSDGGVVRTSGDFVDRSAECATRPHLRTADLATCELLLSAIPDRIWSLNQSLRTLQFQSLSVNPFDPWGDVMGGTQDNGTLAYSGTTTWTESVGGDGGQSGVDAGNPDIRVHTYFGPTPDVNFHGTDPLFWDWTGDPLFHSGELASFYVPIITDPVVSGTMFIGMQHVWRTKDNGGDQAYLDAHCHEYGTPDPEFFCGDWVPLGPDLTSRQFGTDKFGHYVVATERAPSDQKTLWAATRIGRVFVSKDASRGAARKVTFRRIDTSSEPERFVSGIAVDPSDANHAWISYSGYAAYTPGQPGHVFDVHFNPGTGSATWTDITYNLGDQPITDVVLDSENGDLFASTDWTVYRLPEGSTTWTLAAPGLPLGAVYGLTIDSGARVLYAATHGRGAWRLDLLALG